MEEVAIRNISLDECKHLGGKYDEEARICYVQKRQSTITGKLFPCIKYWIQGAMESSHLSASVAAGISSLGFGKFGPAAVMAVGVIKGLQKVTICREYIKSGKNILKQEGEFKKLKELARDYQMEKCGSEEEFYYHVLSE